MKNIDIVTNYIINKLNSDYIYNCINEDDYLGVDASNVEDNLNIVRNNASTILNQLFKQNKLVKINSRPVSFFPRDILVEKGLINNDDENIIFSLDEFKTLLKSLNKQNEKMEDPFSGLIGADSSLVTQIGQAKAALMYPPKGLHTLILGESGVGKSTFATSMYEYAKINKELDDKIFPFISFNCSDYFNNPQLLLSQLFGHVKGAFTGADTDKAGLVEKANGGILFLDEVHRLPPDGQEMLFFLMDKGEYHKLGESNNTSKSNVMIIAATTEDPNKTLLTTFLRRIPVVITLPPFRDKSVEEKIQVIEALFYNECLNLNMEIRISPEVLKALSLYNFTRGNIGQLKSEIRLLCAKSFLNHLQNNKIISIEFEMLGKDIIDYVFNNNKTGKNEKNYLGLFNDYLILSPSSSEHFYPENVNNNIYNKINEYLNKLKEMNLTKEEIDNKISLIIEDHFKDLLNNLNVNNLSKSTLYKIISKDVVDASVELISLAEKELNTILNPKFIFAFAFHINSLLQRISENRPIVNSDLLKIRIQYPIEYRTSKLLVNKISEKFGVLVPEDEKAFLSILLANNKIDADVNLKIAIITICHGESTATSMADVANKLLNTTIIKAIDMPLDVEISNVYNKFKSIATSNKFKEILLTVDMGSLCDFGNNLEKETGIKVRTINNISTLFLVEALRKVMYTDGDLDTIYNSLVEITSPLKTNISPKQKAILTFCVTGLGAGMMAKEIISNNLSLNHKNQIEIISTNYSNLKSNIQALTDKYDILACIGSINPNLSIPYFPINKIMSDNFKTEFSKYLDAKIVYPDMPKLQIENDNKSIYEISKEMLEQYLKYINPKIALVNIKKFTKILGLDDSDKNKDNAIDLIVHMGCMLDRCIHGDKVKFDNLENFKINNLNEFMKVREACKLFENEYDTSINDDEICYIVKVLNK